MRVILRKKVRARLSDSSIYEYIAGIFGPFCDNDGWLGCWDLASLYCSVLHLWSSARRRSYGHMEHYQPTWKTPDFCGSPFLFSATK